MKFALAAGLSFTVTLILFSIFGGNDGRRYHRPAKFPDSSTATTMPIVFKAVVSRALSDLKIDSASSHVHAFDRYDLIAIGGVDWEARALESASGIEPEFLGKELKFVPASEVVSGAEGKFFQSNSEMPALVWDFRTQSEDAGYFIDCNSGVELITYEVFLVPNTGIGIWDVFGMYLGLVVSKKHVTNSR